MTVPSRSAAVVRLARPRYLALTIPPFLIGAMASAEPDDLYMALGVLAIVLLRGISSIGNCIADRIEDEIDHPARAELCRRVGLRPLDRIVRSLFVAYLGVVAVMAIAVPIEPLVVVLWTFFLAVKVAYSFGPRLKPKRYSATLLLGAVSGAMLGAGWMGTSLEGVATAVCAGLVLWSFGASLCGSKDVPNVEGDLTIGYRSVYLDIVEGGRPILSAVAIVSRPYVVVAIAAWFTSVTEGPGGRLLWCFLLYPCAVTLAVLIVRARSERSREVVREAGYLYWLLSMGIVLFCFVPTFATAIIVLAAPVFFLAMSRLAHPDPVPALSWSLPRAEPDPGG